MKRFLILLILLVSSIFYFNSLVFAEEAVTTTTTETTTTTNDATLDLSTLIAKLPSLKNSIVYSYNENTVKYAMSFAVAGIWKQEDGENLISIDAMYVPTDEIGGMATIKLVNFGKILNFPLLDYINIRPGIFVAANNIGSGSNDIEFDWGGVVSLIDIKF